MVGRSVPAEPRLTRRVRPTFHNRTQLLQQTIAGANAFDGRRVQKGEILNIAEPKGLHPQNDIGEIAALNLRLRKPGPVDKILLGIESDTYAVTDTTAPTFALVRTALRYRLDRQPARAALRHVAADAGESGVDHEADAGNRERSLGNVRRHHDFSALRRREDALLLDVRQPAKERHHLQVAQIPALDQIAHFTDVPLGRQKDQDIARGTFVQDALHRFFGRVDVGVFGVFALHLFQRRIDDLHRKYAARYLHDRRTVKGLGKRFGVDRGRSDDDPQVRPPQPQPAQMTENKIDIERTLVRLIHNDGVVFAQLRIAL